MKYSMTRYVLPLCLTVGAAGSAFAQSGSLATQGAAADTPPTPVLVELFTSEGCSSCPPADALIRKLDGMRVDGTVFPGGLQIIALSEHVTYWNRLGWVDPYSQDLFSARQNTYGENFNRDEVYTPQVVVNGAQEALGSDRDAVLQAVKAQAESFPIGLQILSAVPSGGSLMVHYMVTGGTLPRGVEMYAVVTDDHDMQQVQHGENAGRTLTHVSVVRSMVRAAALPAGLQAVVSIPMPPGPPTDGGRHLVLIAQLAGQGKVVGLARQALPSSDSHSRDGSDSVAGSTLPTR